LRFGFLAYLVLAFLIAIVMQSLASCRAAQNHAPKEKAPLNAGLRN